ncbi:MAG: GEVED domain-containing protein [Bacteroidales bacterium]|jgi:PKD repeat protein|nr:GEVED domain-containing protein [Bacteroidales bacterium]
MKIAPILLSLLLINALFSFAQGIRVPGSHLARPTPQGEGKIDTRIDNMRYWKRMADSGYVYVSPYLSISPAQYTGSRIESPLVMTVNSPDVPTTTVNSTQSENSVFVNPINNQALLNSNNSTQNPVGSLYGADYLLSTDGGATWGGSVNGAGGSNSGDPTTAIGLNGRQYIGFIDSNSGQSVAYSTNNGNTWTTVVAALENGDLLDKNHMWIDNSSVSPYEGNIYVAYTDLGAAGYPIEITRSNNDGLSYGTPIAISSAVNAGSHNQGVNIQTGPDGEVYVIWAIYDSWPSDETAIGFAKSTDGGATFAPATRIISNIRGIRTTETSKDHRVNSFPSMAVDISGGPYNGMIYIVWANTGVPGTNTGPDIDVYMIRSSDEGLTWSAPVKVNQDQPGQGKEHYFPWITCDRVSGVISVVFYDDRNVSSDQCEVYVASSCNAGEIWEDYKVSDVAFTPAPIPGLAGGYMGDYLGITSGGNRVYPAWTDNRSGTTLTYTSPIDISPIPEADFLVSNPHPCQGDTVVLMDHSARCPTAWSWTITPPDYIFVNGTSHVSQNPEVKFNSFGNYSVRLIASTDFGSDTLIRTDFISVNYANADFIADGTEVVINNPITFTDLSSCNVTSYSWNFGLDAAPATASNAGPHNVIYSSTGTKTITLTVNGNVTETKTDYIEVLPEVFNMSNLTITTCSGTFYDPQGDSDYLNNLDYTMTFMPADTSRSLRMIFSLFDLEAHSSCNYDYLKIYDGTTTSATLLGTWCGIISPDTVTATNASGALTFHFHSDGSVVGDGWIAAISCVTPPPLPPPSYCNADASACDEFIENVQFNTINNSTGCTSGGYNNYTGIFTRVSPGIPYTITVINGDLGWPGDQCGLWIDWNQDFDFYDAGETLTVSGTPGSGPYTAVAIPPLDAAKGLTRLRIRIMWTGTLSPCGTASYGEVEDYGVYVGTPGLWVGGTPGAESDWNTTDNWDDGRIPSVSTDVIIPSGLLNYPEISGVLNCQDLQIKDGAEVVVQPGASLSVTGDLIVGQGSSGNLIIDGGTCIVNGVIATLPGGSIVVFNGGYLNDYH